jgi:RES domain-containing protein
VGQIVYAWRIVSARKKASALDGIGAARNAGRWNPLGVRVVYCAESLALAVLEIRVHLPIQNQPTDTFVGLELEIAGNAIECPAASDLPSGWQQTPASSTEDTPARRFGAQWITQGRSVCIQLPSAIVPSESIFLLNPLHPGFAKAVRHNRELPVFFDSRLWARK